MVDTNKLKGRIAAAGYTQRTLAPAVKMSVNSLNAKINGRRKFDCEEADLLCEVLLIKDNQEKAEIFLGKSSQKWDA